MIYERFDSGCFVNGECLEVMSKIQDNYVDMILCDLPYGTTQNKWDAVIPFDKLWAQYERVAKSGAAIVLTASQPFTSSVVSSRPSLFKYEWIWRKNNATGHLNAKRMPMKEHESVLVFCGSTYNPQGLRLFAKKVKRGGNGDNFGKSGTENFQEFTNYPRSILEVEYDSAKIHPTQKPVALFEYLIRTYTNPGERVLDNCTGSGTTAIAAINSGRIWTCIERDETYYTKAVERVRNHVKPIEPTIEAAA